MSPSQPPSQERRDTSDLEKGRNAQTTTDFHREKSRSSQKQSSLPPSQPESNFGDSSGPIFSLYSKAAKEEDDGKVERWQKEADGILIFTGLFSASVAALLAVTVQDLRPNAQDTSAFYLGNIYQILADPNATVSHTSIPYPVVKPPPFSPPGYAVLVNSLWFLSLVISLTCALLATSVQQWARRYTRVSQPSRCSPEKRARLRAFFARGVDKMHVPWAVEAVPVLLHASLFLFFAGLVTFLLNVNHCVYFSVFWWVGLFSMLYGCITFMPIFRPDSPYYTPLSPPVSFISYLVLLAIVVAIDVLRRCAIIVAALHSFLRRRFDDARAVIRPCIRYHNPGDSESSEDEGNRSTPVDAHFFNRTTEVLEHQAELIRSSRTAAEEIILEQPLEIDLIILDWAIDALGEDKDLETFFGAIPGFFKSQMVKGLKENLSHELRSKFAESWGGFLARSLLYNSVSEETKNRRLAICMNAITNIYDGNNWSKIFCELSSLRFDQITPSIQAAQILAPWFQSRDIHMSELARYTVAKMLPYVRNRDDHWITLAGDVYGLSQEILRDHIARRDDSVLLAIFIHAARQVIATEPWKWEMLSSISKFDIERTHFGLKIDFCSLWNEIAEKANRESVYTGSNLTHILDGIHHLYVDLHPGTDATLTYVDLSSDNPAHPLFRLCQVDDHRSTDSPPTHHRGSYHAIPYRSRSKSPLTHGGNTDLQQAEEANFTPRPTSPAHAPPHPQLSLSSANPPSNSGKQDSNEQRDNEDIAVPHSASDVTQIPSADNQIPQFIPNICPTLQTSEDATGTCPISASDSLLVRSPCMIPAPCGGSTLEGLPSGSLVESAPVQPHRISHPPRSSLATVHPDVSPQISPDLDAQVSTSRCAPSVRRNSGDGTHSIPMVDPRHGIRSVSSTPDIVGHASGHRGRQDY